MFCMGSDATGVSIKGLKYPMKEGTLSATFPLGVSNHFTGNEAKVSVKDGTILILYKRGCFL